MTDKMTLPAAQTALQTMFKAGMFLFDEELPTIALQDYEEIRNNMEPVDYEVAYNIGPINFLEKCMLDYDAGRVDVIRREKTWNYNGLQAFESTITQLPPLILVTVHEDDHLPKTLCTTWWVDKDGDVVAYLMEYNNHTLERIGFE